jgi:hypothetical protein
VSAPGSAAVSRARHVGRGLEYYDVGMNPVKKLMSWWRGPTDPETLASDEAQRLDAARRQTIRISQNTAARQSSLLSAPTPDVLGPGSEDSHSR